MVGICIIIIAIWFAFIECTNNFIQVIYKETTSISEPVISCVYLKQSDASNKTCCIGYGICDQETFEYTQQECNEDFPYNIQLDVSGHSRQTYCYTVTASNDTYTVKVKGNFSTGKVCSFLCYSHCRI